MLDVGCNEHVQVKEKRKKKKSLPKHVEIVYETGQVGILQPLRWKARGELSSQDDKNRQEEKIHEYPPKFALECLDQTKVEYDPRTQVREMDQYMERNKQCRKGPELATAFRENDSRKFHRRKRRGLSSAVRSISILYLCKSNQ